MRDPKERLRDILEGIGNIERYAAHGRQAFESDELIQNWFPLSQAAELKRFRENASLAAGRESNGNREAHQRAIK